MNYQITDHEKFMMEKMGDYLARYVETSIPVTLDFQPKTIYFEIDGTENFGLLTVARNVAEDISIAGLAAITKDGIATVRAALNELEANGYLTRKRVRREDGKLEHNEYTFYEIPQAGKPAQEKPEKEMSAEDLPA